MVVFVIHILRAETAGFLRAELASQSNVLGRDPVSENKVSWWLPGVEAGERGEWAEHRGL